MEELFILSALILGIMAVATVGFGANLSTMVEEVAVTLIASLLLLVILIKKKRIDVK